MQGISDIITIPGLVNVDFADVKAIMCNSGTAMLGVGVSSGKNRAEEAALVRCIAKPSIVSVRPCFALRPERGRAGHLVLRCWVAERCFLPSELLCGHDG